MRSTLVVLLLYMTEVIIAKDSDSLPKLTASSHIPWLAPSEFKGIDTHVKTFWESEWSKSTYEPSCSDDQLKIVPVYFWPGDRIDLPCALCELAFVFNGQVKRWARADHITEFLENPQKFVITQNKKYAFITNDPWLEDPSLPVPSDLPDDLLPSSTSGKNEKKLPPVYLQRGGKLSILRSSPSSQGVYFCLDSSSVGSTSLFYVLMAMLPPVGIYPKNEYILDGCGSGGTIWPHANWRFHFLPAVRHERDEGCERNPKDARCKESKDAHFLRLDENGTRPLRPSDSDGQSECDLEFCRVEVIWPVEQGDAQDTNLAIEARWGKWSDCGEGIQAQRREAHCYLVRKGGQRIPEDTVDSMARMAGLNTVFDLPPFDKEGIPLYSSLIPSLIYGDKKISGCKPEDTQAKEYDLAFRQLFLRAMGVVSEDGMAMKTKSDVTVKLRNAFQMCLGYERHSNDWEILIGTYMVQTRKCP